MTKTHTQTKNVGSAAAAEVWGPHYWFFLHSVARTYPDLPNEVTKRKYYDLIMNFPLFIPDVEMATNFSHMLDNYPVSPYLTNRESFIRWVFFIHNKMNYYLEKEEISLEEAEFLYNSHFFTAELVGEKIVQQTKTAIKKYYFIIGFVVLSLFITYVGFRNT